MDGDLGTSESAIICSIHSLPGSHCTQPPLAIISQVAVSATANSATLTYLTPVGASQDLVLVNSLSDASAMFTAQDPGLTLSHSLTFPSLQPWTSYSYDIYVDGSDIYTGYFSTLALTNLIVSTSDISASLSFTTPAGPAAATVRIYDPNDLAHPLASVADGAPALNHKLDFTALLVPQTTYHYDISLGGGPIDTGALVTTPAPAVIGVHKGACGVGATHTSDPLSGRDTCAYTLPMPPDGASVASCSGAGAGASISYAWSPTTANAGYGCPAGTMLWTTGPGAFTCVIQNATPPQDYEDPQYTCDVATGHFSYTFSPHDPVIGPIAHKYLAQYVRSATSATQGLALGVRRGWVEDYYYFGQANAAKALNVSQNSLFAIGSNSKTFNGGLVARYATDPSLAGAHVALSDQVNAYLPAAYQVTSPKSLITLRELGDFTSGIPRDPMSQTTLQLFAELAQVTQLHNPPGSTWEYSNYSSMLLGRLLETRVGTPWETLLQQNLTGPLGMSDTAPILAENGAPAFLLSADQMTRATLPYDCTGNPCVVYNGITSLSQNYNPTSPAVYNPAGGLLSSPKDMMTWLRVNMGYASGGWISPAFLQTSRSGVGWDTAMPSSTLNAAVHVATNLTSLMNNPACKPIVIKDGDLSLGAAGWLSTIGYEPDLGTGAFALSNSHEFDAQGIVEAILNDLPAAP